MIETDLRPQPEHTLLGAFARHPALSLVVFVLMSVVSGIGYYDPTLLVSPPSPSEVESSAAGGMSGGRRGRDGSVQQPRSRASADGPAPDVTPVMLFGGEVMLVLSGEDFFNPTAALAIREAVESLEAMPQVRQVMWMDRAPPLNLFGLPEPALPDHRASQRLFDAARQRALDNPMIAGQLLSADGQTLILTIRIDWFHVRSDADCTTRLADVVRDVLASHQLDYEVGVTGEMPIRLVMSNASQEGDRKFQYLANGVILVLALILFRGPSAVIISALGAIFGVAWTMGCIRFFQFEDNPFNHVVVPVLLSLVGFTDGVHMVSQIRVNRALGLGGRQALVRAVDEVGMACFLTSLTTAIGLGSLGWAYHQVVREFGWSCVMGVGITFLAIMTTIPLACMTPLGRAIHRGQGRGWIERNLEKATRLVVAVLRHRKTFAVLALVLTVITGAITLQLTPDERMLNAIPERSPEAKWLRHIDRAFGGLETAHVLATWDPSIAAESPEVVAVSEQVENLLREEPLLGNPLGIARLIDALPGEATAVDKTSMLELLPPQLRRVFLIPEQHSLKVIFRLQDLGIAKYGEVFERLDQRLATIQAEHPGFVLSLEGSAFWRWQNLYQIMVDLTKSLGTASVVIFLVLATVYRSLRLGLIAIIPNLLPLTVTGSLMWLVGQPLELVSVIAFTVCLGIAVDDTIHFLTRYRMELAHGGEQDEVITRAFRGVGAALIMTTLVLVCGFMTVLWSDTREHHIFAMMGAATMVTALFADLLFLPALLVVFNRPHVTERRD